jgi:RNA polymerase sigma factor (TIGR02999 family)
MGNEGERHHAATEPPDARAGHRGSRRFACSSEESVEDPVSELLEAARKGDRAAMDQLFPLVYDALRRIAHRRLGRERAGQSLSTTDLVHEAYLKLVRLDRIQWQGKAHFLAIAARAMRNILVDFAVKRKTAKRGGGAQKKELTPSLALCDAPAADVVALHEALSRLESIDPRRCRVVECRFFAGMSVEETAEAMGVSPASVKRDWVLARAWLNRELSR